MRKILFIFLLTFIWFGLFVHPSLAFQKESFMSFVYPIRELTPTSKLPQNTLALPDMVYKLSTPSATPITWLLQYDSVSSATTSAFFKQLKADKNEEIGLLLEVTPQWVKEADIQASQTLLNSFTPDDRRKLIDHAFSVFFDRFGFYPQTVGADYLDSLSLEYLAKKYTVKTAILDTAGKSTSTGVFPFFPYFPSRLNALIPAQDAQQKLPISLVRLNPTNLANNEPLNLSQQTVLANTPHGFENVWQNFGQKDLNEFTYLALGVDNATPIDTYRPVFKAILKSIQYGKDKVTLKPQTAAQFGEWLLERYPYTSPAYYYKTSSDDSTHIWYHNPFYQIEISSNGHSSRILNLTIFNDKETEDYRFQFDQSSTINFKLPQLISSYNQVDFDLDLVNANTQNDYWEQVFKKDGKSLILNVHQIETHNFHLDLPSSTQLKRHNTADGVTYLFSSALPYQTHWLRIIFVLILFSLLLIVILGCFKLPPPKLGQWVKKNSILVLIVLIGGAVQLITTFKSGSFTDYGLSFWGPHGHDAFVHLALIESFKRSLWPLLNPTFASHPLVNYHVLYDLMTAILSRLTQLSSLDLYFRLNPLVMSLAMGILIITLLRQWKWSTSQVALSLITVYFAGSLGFIVSLIKTHSIWGGESVFWSTQAVSLQINPPLALSLVILLIYLNLFTKWQKHLSFGRIFGLALLGGLLIQAKAYAAILLIASLLLLTVLTVIKKQANVKQFTLLLLLTIAFTILYFLPTYKQSNNLFVWQPFWFVRSMFEAPDRLGWQKAADAWLAYETNHQIFKLSLLQLLGIGLFIVGNLGIRVLSFKNLIAQLRSNNPGITLIYLISLIGLLIPMFFIQVSNPWNSIQFLYYSLFCLGILTGPALAGLFTNSQTIIRFGLICLALFFLTVPTTLGTLRDYLSPIPATAIDPGELRVLDTLKALPQGTILTATFNQESARKYLEPKPVYAYTSTAYVSALTGKTTYLSDEINLAISNYDFSDQKRDTQRIFLTKDTAWIKNFLLVNQLKYVYITPIENIKVDPQSINLYPILETPTVSLYQNSL